MIELMQRPAGATLLELMTATGWQAHSVRGIISGVLRKKLGLQVIHIRSRDGGPSSYRIDSATVAA